MSEARIQFSIGDLSFEAEGNQEWIAKQLDKILDSIPRISPTVTSKPDSTKKKARSTGEFKDTLASHIKKHGGDSNQVQRFLTTADWLRLRGEASITTAKVTKALRDNQQKGLSNPADKLNKNVSKGYCEKSGDGFFITPEGLSTLGHKE